MLSGPSGVGKSTLIDRLKADQFPITHCVTATTRPRRTGEEHGVHYYFLEDIEYDRLLANDEFLEHAVVHGSDYYGTLKSEVEPYLARGEGVLLDIDVQGAEQVDRLLVLPPGHVIAARGREPHPGREPAGRQAEGRRGIARVSRRTGRSACPR